MSLHFRSLLAAAVIALISGTVSAAPVPIIAGMTVDSLAYDGAGVSAGDPDWFGTIEASGQATANRTRDGFDGFEVVEGLYNVDAFVDWTVTRATNGQLVFGYDFSAVDNVGAGLNGVLDFTLSGFAGYDLNLAWTGPAFPYVPSVSRSADGDAISFDFFDPLGPIFGGIETILIAVDAPSFRTNGGGTAGIVLDTFGIEQVALSGPLPVPAPVPLPAAAGFLLAALGGLFALRRKA